MGSQRGGESGGLVNGWKVIAIARDQYERWLIDVHYAHVIPCVMYSFGLFDERGILRGVCTFGNGPMQFEDGSLVFGGAMNVRTLELNRLVVDEGLEKNRLSFFVSRSLRSLPTPVCVVSYSDANLGHHGYIYQATNFVYTGMTSRRYTYHDATGKRYHSRTTWDMYGPTVNIPIDVERSQQEYGKHRYVTFVGNPKEKREMRRLLSWPVMPYPKGDNERYLIEQATTARQMVMI
jgi:hypothetical protein